MQRARKRPAGGEKVGLAEGRPCNNISIRPAQAETVSKLQVAPEESCYEDPQRRIARAGRHRPPDPGRAAGERPHHQCRACQARRDLRPALPATGAAAGGGGRDPRLPCRAGPGATRLADHLLRPGGAGQPEGGGADGVRADGLRMAGGARVPYDTRRRGFFAAAGGARHDAREPAHRAADGRGAGEPGADAADDTHEPRPRRRAALM